MDTSIDHLTIFIDNIKDYMAKESISVSEFARRVGVYDAAVANWLALKYFPTVKSAVKIADLLNCSLDYLFGLSSDARFTPSAGSANFFDRFDELCRERDLTYYRVAKKCNFGQSAISKWKAGKYPKTEKLISIAENFGFSLDYLVGRSDAE